MTGGWQKLGTWTYHSCLTRGFSQGGSDCLDCLRPEAGNAITNRMGNGQVRMRMVSDTVYILGQHQCRCSGN